MTDLWPIDRYLRESQPNPLGLLKQKQMGEPGLATFGFWEQPEALSDPWQSRFLSWHSRQSPFMAPLDNWYLRRFDA